ITVCGQSINGGKFYENCYGLLSPNFTIQNNGNNGEWVFTTNGNGHCVGMSQYGAAGYIAYGWSWQQVLLHYFPGTVLNTVP
ncbi:MAG: stage II sporulation protein D, partial [Oscillospiraceae bacterium]